MFRYARVFIILELLMMLFTFQDNISTPKVHEKLHENEARVSIEVLGRIWERRRKGGRWMGFCCTEQCVEYVLWQFFYKGLQGFCSVKLCESHRQMRKCTS